MCASVGAFVQEERPTGPLPGDVRGAVPGRQRRALQKDRRPSAPGKRRQYVHREGHPEDRRGAFPGQEVPSSQLLIQSKQQF